METKDYLRLLRDRIHSTVMATLDAEGRPITRVIDIMLADDDSLYFLTARGKEFYDQLTAQKYIALTGLMGGEGLGAKEATLHKTSVSLRGTVENIGGEKLAQCFAQNPYMAAIYPDPESRKVLEVFRIKDAVGEFFEIADGAVTRKSFALGSCAARTQDTAVFMIGDGCIGCGACTAACPQQCIDGSGLPFRIDQEHCIHCGNCEQRCPSGAIVRRQK